MTTQFTPKEFSDHCHKIVQLIDDGHLGYARLAIAGLDAMFKRSGALVVPAGKIDLTDVAKPGRVEMFIVEDARLLPESAGFIVPDGEQINLCDLRPGLFLYRGGLGLKTEYFTDRYADVYTADSGETFWGGTVDRSDRDMLIVQPVKFVEKAG